MYDETKLGEEVLTFLEREPADDLDRLAHRAVRILVDTAGRSWNDESHLPLARMLAHSTLFLISRQGKHYRFIPRHLENRNTVDQSGEILGFNDVPTDAKRLLALAEGRVKQAERIVLGETAQNVNVIASDPAQRASQAWQAIMRETGATDYVPTARSPHRQNRPVQPEDTASPSWFGSILGLSAPRTGFLQQLGFGAL